MTYPKLNDTVINEVNKLTEMEREKHYAFCHELLWYGIDAVAHAHLMRMAKKNLSDRKLSLGELIDRYGLAFGENYTNITIKADSIVSDGIFLPQHKVLIKKFSLFNRDYLNRVWYADWKDKEYAEELIRRKWEPNDLEDKDLVLAGERFGKDMWLSCVKGFNQYKNGYRIEEIPKQPKDITILGEKLIKYYSKIVAGANQND